MKTLDNTNAITIKDGSFTLNNTADTTKVGVFSLSGNTTGTTRTYTMPNASVTLASLTGTETLTNKTITSPTITGGTIDNTTITVDSISGHSVATTVTVANLQIANGVLNSANAVTSTSVAAGAIQPQALVSGTGTGWSWSSWSPSYANLSVGNGTVVSEYTQIGKTVFLRFEFTLGSTSTVSTNPSISLPVTSVAYQNTNQIILSGVYSNNAGSGTNGYANYVDTTHVNLKYWDVNNNTASVTATVPYTFATNFAIYMDGFYEAA
jgi:hypothetical protein